MKTPIALSCVLILLCACAAEVLRAPVEFAPASQQSARRYVILQPLVVSLDTGRNRKLDPGVELIEVGSVGQGQVLRPTNAVFTIVGANIHEAYLVVNDGRVVGFYLPVERAFSPLSRPAVLSIKESIK